jgi:DNA-binding NarL/FixJ family response regulator
VPSTEPQQHPFATVDQAPAVGVVRDALEAAGIIVPDAVLVRLTARLQEQLPPAVEPGPGMRPVRSPLTAREWEVLDLLCTGCTTAVIAREMCLSRETVRTHVRNMLRKLDVHSRKEAIAVAERLRAPTPPAPVQ